MQAAHQEHTRSESATAASDALRRRLLLLLLLYCAFVAAVVLLPTGVFPSAVVGWVADRAEAIGAPDQVLVGYRVEFALNALMIAPLSALGSLLWSSWTWRDWTALAFVASATVELTQGLLLPDRSATFVDVCANTAGALVGAVTTWLIVWLRDRP
jgi:hypothetical protein